MYHADFPNIKMNTVPHLELVQFIEHCIDDFQAEAIVTHHPTDTNNDHVMTSGAAQAACRLFQRKHYYFVPYGQDDPAAKPQSLKADFARLPAALEAALHGEQLQPVLLGQRERAMAFQPGQNVVY